MPSIFLFLILAIICNTSLAQTAEPLKVYAVVGKTQSNKDWAQDKCKLLHQAFNLNSLVPVVVNCEWLKDNPFLASSVSDKNIKANHTFYADLREQQDGTIDFRIINFSQIDELDFLQSSWQIKPSENSVSALSKTIQNVLLYHFHKYAVREHFLRQGIKDSATLALNSKNEIVDKLTLTPLDSEVAIQQFVSEKKRHVNLMRSSTEVLVALGAGLTWYVINLEHNRRDWDYQSVSDSLRSRFRGYGIRHDDNNYKGINEPHIWAGWTYYLACRSNAMTNLEAFLCTFTASLAWETIVEYHEVLSINDQVITGIGGSWLGESFHQIAKLLRKKNTFLSKSLAKAMDPVTALNNFLDRKKDIKSSEFFNDDVWGSVELYVGYQKHNLLRKNPVVFGLKGEAINIADYERTGTAHGWEKDTPYSSLDFQIGKDFSLINKAVLIAYHQKNLVKTTTGDIVGYNFLIGPSGGVELRSRENESQPGDFKDFMGVVNIVGLSAHVTIYKEKYKLTAQVSVFPKTSYAMIRSLAIDSYKTGEGTDGLANVLADQEYYFSLGSTVHGMSVFQFGKFAIGAAFFHGSWDSINGRYRNQHLVTKDIELQDSRSEGTLFVEYKISKNFTFRLSTSRVIRKGNILGTDYSEKIVEKKYLGTLSYLF